MSKFRKVEITSVLNKYSIKYQNKRKLMSAEEKMSHKADELRESIRRIKEAIENTQDSTEFGNDITNGTSDMKKKHTLEAQSKLRAETVSNLLSDL